MINLKHRKGQTNAFTNIYVEQYNLLLADDGGEQHRFCRLIYSEQKKKSVSEGLGWLIGLTVYHVSRYRKIPRLVPLRANLTQFVPQPELLM